MTDVVADSRSVILRSTHIVLVRILEFQAGAWEPHANGFDRRTVSVRLGWVEALKGEATPKDPPPLQFSVAQYRNAGHWLLPEPGVWSHIELKAGAEVVVFSHAGSAVPANVLREEACDLVQPAEQVLPGVLLAEDAIERSLPLPSLLEEARLQAASLDELFCDFVWERYRGEVLGTPRAFEAYLSFLEEPALTPVARSVLLTHVYSAVADGIHPAQETERLAVTLFRLLALPQAQTLRDNLVMIYLPNLLGLQGGSPPRSAGEVFRHAPQERSLARQALSDYTGSADPSRLLTWLQ